MKRLIGCSLIIAFSGCWADFPENLLSRRDASPDLGGLEDARRDAPLDSMQGDLRPKDGKTENVPDVSISDSTSDSHKDGTEDGVKGDAADGGKDGSEFLLLGEPCGADKQCYSNHCSHGVCCNLDCEKKPCMACDLLGRKGECLPVPQGEDPHNDCSQVDPQSSCGFDGACDGKGGCQKWQAGTLCAPASCGGSKGEKVIQPKICDGEGGCVATSTIDCSPYLCNAATLQCHDTCSTVDQCVDKGPCTSEKCSGSAKPLGAQCKDSKDCASGFCVEGVCCQEACAGVCKTCRLTLPLAPQIVIAGHCMFVPKGLDPRDDCPQKSETTCDLDGSCDGKGTCRLWPEGTYCATPKCTSGAMTPYSVCNPAGKCVAQDAGESCGSYQCLDNRSCFAWCATSLNCLASKSCDLTTHTCK